MSRTARQSMYPSPPGASHWTALDACSAALQASCSNLESAVGILHQGTMDLPRLAGIVQSRRMFDLVTEPEVFSAQRALANEMAPQVDELIRRAEDGLEGLKQKERTLRAKVEKRQAAASRSQAPITVDQSELDTLEQKLASLQQKKNRLGREVEALDERAAKASARARPGAATAGRGVRR
ncbi:hypothetical protein JCM10295v2_003238 [Rhodotorula toruloides]